MLRYKFANPVLLWADMNAATPLGAWGRSVMSLGPVSLAPYALDVDGMCETVR